VHAWESAPVRVAIIVLCPEDGSAAKGCAARPLWKWGQPREHWTHLLLSPPPLSFGFQPNEPGRGCQNGAAYVESSAARSSPFGRRRKTFNAWGSKIQKQSRKKLAGPPPPGRIQKTAAPPPPSARRDWVKITKGPQPFEFKTSAAEETNQSVRRKKQEVSGQVARSPGSGPPFGCPGFAGLNFQFLRRRNPPSTSLDPAHFPEARAGASRENLMMAVIRAAFR